MRKEKAERMKFAFQLNNGMETVLLAGYENGFTNRQAREKKNTARLHTDTEMRVTANSQRPKKKGLQEGNSQGEGRQSPGGKEGFN